MQQHGGIVAILFPLVAFGGPLLLGLAGIWLGRGSAAAPSAPPPWDWRLTALSAILAVTIVGISWIRANAWRVTDARPGGFSAARPLLYPFAALLILLLIFQLILRPGIPFY